MKCHTYRGVHIPGCWGCAVYGHRRCHCPPAARRTTTRSLTAERGELRAALRDLRAHHQACRVRYSLAEGIPVALRARIDALIGPYGEHGGDQ